MGMLYIGISYIGIAFGEIQMEQELKEDQYHRFAPAFHNVSLQRCRFRYLLHTAFLVE